MRTYLIENELGGVFDLVVLGEQRDVLGNYILGIVLGQVLGSACCIMTR